jgi:hypothetical protein
MTTTTPRLVTTQQWASRQKPLPARIPEAIRQYTFTEHARSRCLERNISPDEVFAAIAEPEVRRSGRAGRVVFERGDVSVRVDTGVSSILTVVDLDEDVRTQPRVALTRRTPKVSPVTVVRQPTRGRRAAGVEPDDEVARRAALEPDPRTLRWMLEPHGEATKPWGTMETRYVFMSPTAAELALAQNSHNRPPSRTWVDYWRHVMESDEFRLTHQGVAFDTFGRLQDGQNRLTAIVDTGVGQWMQVTVGCPIGNFPDIDAGKGRSLGDTLSIIGIPSATLAGSVCRLLFMYDMEQAGQTTHNKRCRAADAEKMAQQHPALLLETMRWAKRTRKTLDMIGSAAAAMAYLILRANPHHGWEDEDGRPTEKTPLAWRFLRGVAEGADLSAGDARLLLRNALPASSSLTKRDNTAQLGLGLRAWNRYVAGTNETAIIWRRELHWPAVSVVAEDDMYVEPPVPPRRHLKTVGSDE